MTPLVVLTSVVPFSGSTATMVSSGFTAPSTSTTPLTTSTRIGLSSSTSTLWSCASGGSFHASTVMVTVLIEVSLGLGVPVSEIAYSNVSCPL